MNIILKKIPLLDLVFRVYKHNINNREKIKFTYTIVDYNVDIEKANELTKRYVEFRVKNKCNKDIYLKEFAIKLKDEFKKILNGNIKLQLKYQ